MWSRSIGYTAIIVSLSLCASARAQLTPEAYQELFQDPPRTAGLTQVDLPNLGRLVVLEATSMFVHARSELANSPNSFRLLEQIRTLWSAADGFTSTVAEVPLTEIGLQAGRLSFVDLEQAYNQVRDSFSVLPGGAPLAGQNMVNAGRAIAVIGPLLSDRETSAATRAPSFTMPREIRTQARELLSSLESLKRRIGNAAGEVSSRTNLDGEIDRLASLMEGLDRVAEGSASQQDLGASLRPVRFQLQRVGQELQRAGLDDLVRSNELRSIQRRVDGLADRLRLPREIFPQRPLAVQSSDQMLRRIDKSIGEADRVLQSIPANELSLDRRLLAADTRRLRSRLFLLRQALVGRDTVAQVSQSIQNLERSRRQLSEAASRATSEVGQSIQSLLKETDATIRQARETLSKSP